MSGTRNDALEPTLTLLENRDAAETPVVERDEERDRGRDDCITRVETNDCSHLRSAASGDAGLRMGLEVAATLLDPPDDATTAGDNALLPVNMKEADAFNGRVAVMPTR